VLIHEGLAGVVRKLALRLDRLIRRDAVDPEALERIPEDVTLAYQRWRERQPLAASDIGTRTGRPTDAPSIALVLELETMETGSLRRSVASLRGQTDPRWRLLVIGGALRPDALAAEGGGADDRVVTIPSRGGETVADAINRAVNALDADFMAFLRQGDVLHPEALFRVGRCLVETPGIDLVYSDADCVDADGRHVRPFFKPDWSPDLLLSTNYVGQLCVIRRALFEKVGGLRHGFVGAGQYDLVLRCTEQSARIAHLPQVLYHAHGPGPSGVDAGGAAASEVGRRAIEDALVRRGRSGQVQRLDLGRHAPPSYTVRYRLRATPLVSIVIPTRDRAALLEQCIRSIEEHTDYQHYEIVVVDNDSQEPATLAYLDDIRRRWRVVPWPGRFNYAGINNAGAGAAAGEHLLFLNNDTQVAVGDWLRALVEHGQRRDVGAVGARLLFPDGRIQHAGLVVGAGGQVFHPFRGQPGEGPGYCGLPSLIRNCSAVTGACLLVPRRVFQEIGGFDERFRVAYNDVDLCLRSLARGYLVVYTPHARLYHYEAASRGRLHPPEDERLFRRVWGTIRHDPYYNVNLNALAGEVPAGG
jgi:GT2 family glycosyltransferase